MNPTPADQEFKQMFNGVKVAVALGGLLVCIGFGIGSSEIMPQNAELYLDHSMRLYISPPCVSLQDRAQLSLATVAEARKLAYQPEPKCRDEGGFTQDGRSLSGRLFEWLGVVGPLQGRWNLDGSWNW